MEVVIEDVVDDGGGNTTSCEEIQEVKATVKIILPEHLKGPYS